MQYALNLSVGNKVELASVDHEDKKEVLIVVKFNEALTDQEMLDLAGALFVKYVELHK